MSLPDINLSSMRINHTKLLLKHFQIGKCFLLLPFLLFKAFQNKEIWVWEGGKEGKIYLLMSGLMFFLLWISLIDWRNGNKHFKVEYTALKEVFFLLFLFLRCLVFPLTGQCWCPILISLWYLREVKQNERSRGKRLSVFLGKMRSDVSLLKFDISHTFVISHCKSKGT